MLTFEEFIQSKQADGTYGEFENKMLPYKFTTELIKQWISEYFEEIKINKEEYIRIFDTTDYQPKCYGEPKRFKSVYRKVYDGEIKKDQIFNTLNDLARARVVCRYLSQARYLMKNMANRYLCSVKGAQLLDTGVKDYITKAKESGYRSFNVNFTLPATTFAYSGPIKCELQIRTELQDMWGNCEHSLVYRNFLLKKIPDSKKKNVLKQMVVISNLLYNIDELLDITRCEILKIVGTQEF